MDNTEIGSRIKSIRLKRGETAEVFAKHFTPPASKGTISKWENGRYLPNNLRLKKIAELGDITVEELLYGKKLEIASFDTSDEFLAEREKILKKIKLIEISSRIEMLDNDYVRSLINKGEEKVHSLLSNDSIKIIEETISNSIEVPSDNDENTENLVQMNIESFYLSIALLDKNSAEYISKFSIITKEEQEIILRLLDSMIKK